MYPRNIEPHKYLEVIEQDNNFIILFSDDGSTITRETHTYEIVSKGIGFLEKGSVVETIKTETASGSWEDRYELEYSDGSSSSTEESTPTTDSPEEPEIGDAGFDVAGDEVDPNDL